MVASVARVLWRVWCWIELAVAPLLLYGPSYLPKAPRQPWYFSACGVACS